MSYTKPENVSRKPASISRLKAIALPYDQPPSAANTASICKSADDFVKPSAIDVNDRVAAVVLTGAGGVFCAGADLSRGGGQGAVYRPWAGADGPPATCAETVIAAVEGHAVAGGLGTPSGPICGMSETAVFGVFCRRFGVPMSDGTPTRLPKVAGPLPRPRHAVDGSLPSACRSTKPTSALPTAWRPKAKRWSWPPISPRKSRTSTLAMRADCAAAWAAFDDNEAAQLIAEDEGAQAAKKAKPRKVRTTGCGSKGIQYSLFASSSSLPAICPDNRRGL